MKKVIIGLLVIMLGSVSFSTAQRKEGFTYGLAEVRVAPFERITIRGKVEIVLVQTQMPERVFIEGNQQDLTAITVTSKDGELAIAGSRNYTGSEKLVVTVYYNNLKKIAGNFNGGSSSGNIAGN